MKLILCIVVEDATAWLRTLRAHYANLLDGDDVVISGRRFELDVCHADERIRQAFEVSACRLHPSMEERDFELLDSHGAVIYAVSEETTVDDQAFATAQAALVLAAICSEIGALGVKCETAGVAHHPRRWISLYEQVAEATAARRAGQTEFSHEIFRPMIEAFVRMPIANGDTLYTCGMHHLGRPDVAITGKEPHEAALWLTMFCLYQTAEAPADALQSGQGFRLDEDGERRLLVHRLDPGWYTPDDLFHNPWGVWFLETEG